MSKVFIGVGHGGADPGAAANGFNEKDLNLAIALACRDVLMAHGVTVGMSRTKDENDDLSEEIKECNAFAPDYALDIHNNAGGGDGAEVFHAKASAADDKLAQNVLDAIKALGQNSRGLKTRSLSDGRDYYGFIRQINAPSIIVECAFVDNKTDLAIIDTAAEQKAMGEAIAKGVLKTLGIAYNATTTNSDILYCVQTGAFAVKDNATALANELKGKGYDTYIVFVDSLYKVQVGAFAFKANADAILAKLKEDGYSAFVAEKSTAEAQKPTKKSVDELAREVINGEWGNGYERKNRLQNAGYDYSAVQKKVNELCKN